jgi:hypothetical protein
VTAALVPGDDVKWDVLKTLAAHGASVGDFTGHAHWVAQGMPASMAAGAPEAVARAAVALVEAGTPSPGVPALADPSAGPAEPWCGNCGRCPHQAALVRTPDGPRCDDADDCTREREARLPRFRQQWSDLWSPSAGRYGWHWAERRSGGQPAAGGTSFPVYDETVSVAGGADF